MSDGSMRDISKARLRDRSNFRDYFAGHSSKESVVFLVGPEAAVLIATWAKERSFSRPLAQISAHFRLSFFLCDTVPYLNVSTAPRPRRNG